MNVIMVLDDGETYSPARGCQVTIVSDTDPDVIFDQLDREEDESLFFIHDGPLGVIIELTELGRQCVRVI